MLDPQGRKDVMATVEMLNRDYGITILLITHYMDEAVRANRVLVMNEGAVILDGPPKRVFQQEDALKRAGLDVPQATRLAAMLRRDGFDLPRDVLCIEELLDALLPLCGPSVPSGTDEQPAVEREAPAETAPAGPVILETQHLTHIYAKGTSAEVKAVDDVSAAFSSGELVGVIGHTGSGKSTYIEHLNGLLRGTNGAVLLEGKDIWAEKKKIRAVRFKVGVCFQYPEYQLFEETVEKDIAFGPKNMALPTMKSPVGSAGCSAMSGWTTAIFHSRRLTCPAAKSGAWPLRASWRWNRRCWCWTSPAPGWTRAAGPWCWT